MSKPHEHEALLFKVSMDQCDCTVHPNFEESILKLYHDHFRCHLCFWLSTDERFRYSFPATAQASIPGRLDENLLAKDFEEHGLQVKNYVIDEQYWYVFKVEKNYIGLALGQPMHSLLVKDLCLLVQQLGKLQAYTKEREHRRLFIEILNKTPYGIQVADESGQLVFINQTASERLGIAPEKVSDYNVRNFEAIFCGEGKWDEHVEDVKNKGAVLIEGVNTNHMTGHSFPVEVTAGHFRAGSKSYILASSRDISERKKAHTTIQQQLKLQDLLIKISSTYINIPLSKIREAIQQSLQEMGEFVNADRAYIFTYDFVKKTTSNTYEWCAEGIDPEIDNLQDTPMEYFPQWLERHRKGEPFHLPDISQLTSEEDKGLRDILEPQGIKSVLAIPMKSGDELLGFVGFDSVREHHVYSETEMKLLFVFAQMLINVSRREQWERQLTQQEERYRNIITNMDMGVLEMTLWGNVAFMNQRFCDMSGLTSEKHIGADIQQLSFSDEYLKILRDIVSKTSTSGKTKEVSVINKKKETRWWLVSHSPQYNDKGEVIGTIVEHLDVTEQKKLQNKLAKAQDIAIRAAKAKEVFLSNMSHEIRTPLTTIIGMIRMLQKEELREELSIYISKTASTAEHLLAILNNTIDISKIEEDALTLQPQPFDLQSLCKDIHGIFSVNAQEKKLPLKLSVDPDISPLLMGDEIRIRQILFNLLSNAVKFTEKGFVKLSADVVETTTRHQRINIEIKDTGIGMSEAFVKRVFDKYAQEHDQQPLKYNSAGLGMFIAHDLAKLMGSELVINSKKGHGTTVSFELKLSYAMKQVPEKKHKELSPDSLKGFNILLVEDEDTNRFLVARSLKNAGAVVTEAENGLKAYELLTHQEFDLILMDIQMPQLDGITATRLARNELKIDTPIIAFTANVFKQDLEKYLDAGMNDYIKKPYNEIDMLSIIKKHLKKIHYISKQTLQQHHLQPHESNEVRNHTDSIDLRKIHEICDGDDEFYLKILGSLTDLFNKSIQQLQTAKEHKDILQIRRTIHKIKPNLELLAREDLKIAIFKLEFMPEEDSRWIEVENQVSELQQQLKIINNELLKHISQ
jgi:PAS domain S-box-containing protein